MHNFWSLLFMASMILAMACGRGDKQDESDESSTNMEATPVAGPRGASGADGDQGAAGPAGPQGERGANGAAIFLFDVAGQEIGTRFAGDDVTADVFLPSGRRALLDMASGELRAPHFNFLCLHETNDCSGSCYVYDHRWLNVLVQDAAGTLYAAARNAVNEGAKTFQSYTHDQNGCTVSSFATTASYRAAPEATTALELPAAAPLYWDLRR